MSMKDIIFSIILEKLEEKTTNPYAIGMAAAMKSTGDEPPLKKSTITKAHKIAKSIEKNEEVDLDEATEYSMWHVQHPTKPTQSYKVKARTSGEAIKKAHKAAIDAGHMKSNVPNTVFKAKHIQKVNEEVELDEAVNAKKVIADHDAGHSVDVIVQKHLNKKADNKDEILKIIRNNAWNKRIKK